MPELDVMTTVDADRRRIKHREERLKLPAIALSEWCQLHGVNSQTAKGWAARDVFPPGAVWLSGRDYLIRPNEPVPETRPGPKPK